MIKVEVTKEDCLFWSDHCIERALRRHFQEDFEITSQGIAFRTEELGKEQEFNVLVLWPPVVIDWLEEARGCYKKNPFTFYLPMS